MSRILNSNTTGTRAAGIHVTRWETTNASEQTDGRTDVSTTANRVLRSGQEMSLDLIDA